jgi:hypothetical protein
MRTLLLGQSHSGEISDLAHLTEHQPVRSKFVGTAGGPRIAYRGDNCLHSADYQVGGILQPFAHVQSSCRDGFSSNGRCHLPPLPSGGGTHGEHDQSRGRPNVAGISLQLRKTNVDNGAVCKIAGLRSRVTRQPGTTLLAFRRLRPLPLP